MNQLFFCRIFLSYFQLFSCRIIHILFFFGSVELVQEYMSSPSIFLGSALGLELMEFVVELQLFHEYLLTALSFLWAVKH